MEESRWSIAELCARYELEPELMDVFVEGAFDREVLAQAVPCTRTGVTFYEINSVDVPATLLAKYDLTSGNKQRVIALSKEFVSLPVDARVVCFVDRDLDHWFSDLTDTCRLRWSRYCSIDSHFLTEEIIRDVLVTTGRARFKRFDDFVISLIDTLKFLFSLRLADRELSLELKWVLLKKYLSRSGDVLAISRTKYIDAVLDSNAKRARKDEFYASQEAWLLKMNCDIRLAARGHDYTTLLAWAISEFGGQKELANEVAVQRLFVLLARSVLSISAELQ